ncbi:FAD-dependent oxidoreductase [Bailinhaonella thermotolerans]|uniref:NAD(P)/FAD-dependent oxidoreductase n=1 Tax=Bailinhaonella thermotolerans TaxID=1070861 RepID=A0A3A4AD50_9ACTN|nr:FAD-dependent oxidoreductase [Bailinhaonella thermotolerans]RJL27246.1 NAD(P)/FAD-dependent oxidoreductase [Bailinhaonella thermotolerans]
MRLVVVGNGMAGSRLVSEVRARSRDVRVTVFGEEAWQPYNRVLLSNVLAGTASPGQIRMQGPSWYADHDVTARLGVRVTRIDREARVVEAEDGTREPYDVCVLATGSEAVVPPIPGLAGERVVAFRTLDDCEAILRAAEGARRAIVIGGGLLGVEAARGLAGRGLPVTVLHLADHLMERQLDAEAGHVLAGTLAGLGVGVRLGVTITAVRADGSAELEGGEVVPGDLVVVACGVRPVAGLARDAGLAVDRGVLVDDRMRTSDPAIYAVGECAQHDGTVYGLVAPAWEQAGVAAAVLTGGEARYTGSRLVTRLKAAEVELAAMGETHLTDEDAEIVRFAHPARGTYRKLVIRDDRLVGAILVGETGAVGTLTQLYDRGTPLPGDRATLLFPGLAGPAAAESPTLMPDSATVCHCNNVSKRAIRACWESGARDVAAVAEGTRATTGCGTCRGAVEGLLSWLNRQDAEAPAG